MSPSKRRKVSTSSQMGHVQRSLRTASAQGNLSAPDADLDAEPEELMCPITHAMFRDPVMVVESGHTYERSGILEHFRLNGAKDPLTNRALSSAKVTTNWAVRQIVQAWLDKHRSVTPDGWDSRELLEPPKDDGTRTFDDEGDVGVLRTWRAMCPELQERWPEDEQPEDWEGVTMDDGRVVKLELAEFGLTGAVPAEIRQLTSLRELWLYDNRLTSLPAEIGQLTSLTHLSLGGNQLTSVPAEIRQLTSLKELRLNYNQLTSVPAEIGQLTSLEKLHLGNNQLTSVPAEIGQLTSLRELYLRDNQLTTLSAEIGQLTSLTELNLWGNKLTSLPAEIGQLTSLTKLFLYNNKLTSLPAEIGQLTSLRVVWLDGNQLTSVPAAIRERRMAGCDVLTDAGVRFDE